MNLDQLAKDLIADEGLELNAYRCTAGYLTIGVGRNLDTNPLSANEERACGHDGRSAPITHNQAMYLLDNDMLKVISKLDQMFVWWDDLDEVRQCAIANMAFQLGTAGLLRFKKALAAMERRDWNNAYSELLDSKWAKIDTPGRAHRIALRIWTGKYA